MARESHEIWADEAGDADTIPYDVYESALSAIDSAVSELEDAGVIECSYMQDYIERCISYLQKVAAEIEAEKNEDF